MHVIFYIMSQVEESKNDGTIKHVLKYTGLFGGVQGINLLVNILRNKLTAILLQEKGIGLINLFNALVIFINNATNFGISFSAIKHVSDLFETGDDEKIRQFIKVVRSWCLLTAILSTSICVLASFFYDNQLDILIISPIVGILAITSGEMAILKGLKQLKRVAKISFWSAISTMFVSIPLYYYLRWSGISLALLLSNIIILLIHLNFSTRIYSYSAHIFNKEDLKQGFPMIKLGVGYIIAGIFGSGAEYFIRESINQIDGEGAVGLYSCGYVMMVQYASVVLASLETDFFPRLTQVIDSPKRMNITIERQKEVCTLLLSPMLIFFVIAMPFLLRLFYTGNFLTAMPMAICASFYIFFKALATPVAYLPLAKGHAKTYMVNELLYDIFIALTIPFAYREYGLMGAGIALSLGGLFDYSLVNIVYRYKYQYRMSFRLLPIYVLQFVLLATSVIVAVNYSNQVCWLVGGGVLLLSIILTVLVLMKDRRKEKRGNGVAIEN